MGMNLECQHNHPLLARTMYRNGWREERRGAFFFVIYLWVFVWNIGVGVG